MSDSKTKSQNQTVGKNEVHRPKQVADQDKHLGATADESIPQDELPAGNKQKAGNKKQSHHK